MDEPYPIDADESSQPISVSADELVDGLNNGIIRAIQTSGKSLPSSSIRALDSTPVQCEWTEFSTELCCPVVEDLRQYFPPLEGGEVGSDGRPLLYAACLGLLFSQRGSNEEDSSKASNPLSTFLSVASFLLDELEVDPNQPTQTKGACLRPPLHLAARSCHPSAVHELLSRGADPNVVDEEGWTALMAACMPDIPSFEQGGPSMEERVGTVEVLMHNEAKVDARNYCGFSALHYACEGLNSALIQRLLEDGGADATLRTVWGQSCIGIIKTKSYINMKEATTCEELVSSHLEKTGQMEDIRSFLDDEEKAIELMNLVEDVLIPASRQPDSDDGCGGFNDQDCRIITALMKHLRLPSKYLFDNNALTSFADEDGVGAEQNLYEIIHDRIMKLLPNAYPRLYRSNPTNIERDIITCTNYHMRKIAETSLDGVRRIDASLLMSYAFRLHRERGHAAHQLEILTDLIVGPLQRTFTFAIPNNAVLKEIVANAPRIVEMGAGTGYWSSMLSRMGADVTAYDAQPPGELDLKDPEGKNGNVYFGSQTYFPVQKGVASTVFDDNNLEMVDRALLMVWPNNPDARDNPHVAVEETALPQIWDLECLERFYEFGGDKVIYVGEREAKIELMHDATDADCGFCSSRKFQLFLQEHYELKVELECSKWWLKEDDVTIWKRKK